MNLQTFLLSVFTQVDEWANGRPFEQVGISDLKNAQTQEDNYSTYTYLTGFL